MSIQKHLGFLSPDHAQMINTKAKELLRDYYGNRNIDARLAIGEMLETLQDHGVSPKELPIMNEMRDVILGRR